MIRSIILKSITDMFYVWGYKTYSNNSIGEYWALERESFFGIYNPIDLLSNTILKTVYYLFKADILSLNQPTLTNSKLTREFQNNVWNLLKVNNRDIRTTSVKSFWCLYCKLWTDFTYWIWITECRLGRHQIILSLPVIVFSKSTLKIQQFK